MKPADMVLKNGNILTMNLAQPQAQAVALQGEKIVKVGTDADMELWIGKNTKVIDLQGRTVVPGFIDTHVHIMGFGRSLTAIDFRGVTSIEEVKRRLKMRVQETPTGKWILGRGWDQDHFVEKRYPTRWDLDEVAPNNPVVFARVCGHVCVVNSKVLGLAGITRETAHPPGGQIDKDSKTGEPTGILRENAMDLVWRLVPEPSEEEFMEICGLACQRAVEAGLTSLHWIIYSTAEVRVIQRLRAQNRLPLRVYIIIPVEHLGHLIDLGLRTGFGDDMVRIGSVKIVSDGSLGARTAALHEPYNDEPTTRGMRLYTQEELDAFVLKAHKAGLQLAIHAIGDQAMDMTLTSYEKALREAPMENHRHRIEHASVLNEELIRRMKKLGVVAAVQPHFIISDFWVVNRVGPKRGRWVYPFKTLLREGIRIGGGSDYPVEPISPLLGIWAAVARESFPEERITVDDAIRIYTINAAYASFEEHIKGSIEAGKLADIVVLSHDPREVPPNKIKDIRVEMTIVGGRVVYIYDRHFLHH
ncbi:MAG: imidazolonepropionase [Candidatus Bathyarchaeota archaeon BA1]|nr:MAG: imidazolonepropionase [Candidatus Bathyarchaeota archaeon BA1]